MPLLFWSEFNDCLERCLNIREDDVEDKLVADPEGIVFKQAEIEKAIYFQEKYYKSKVEVL